MRVISGSAKGRRLRTLKGLQVRPTTDRVKEAVFNLLGPDWEGLRVLDLFAGSGALGIEALSRGAAYAVFVDKASPSLGVIQSNLDACGFADRARLIRADAIRFLHAKTEQDRFDAIFADPPYDSGLAGRCLEAVGRFVALSDSGRMIVEHSRREALPERVENLTVRTERSYGDTTVTVYIADRGVDER